MQRPANAGRSEDDTGASAIRPTVSTPLMNEFHPPATAPAATPAPRPASSSLRRIARAISSPWVSISLLVIVFLHQAIGSAFYTVRQAFEVNEMEWFNGTASLVLWLTICTCLITASIVRVPWTWRKIGTHITHAGVVLLVLTCGIYFGWKHEGDALLVRGYVKVDTEGGACRLLPNPGYRAPLGAAGTATVQAIMPRWTILSPEGKSELAWAILVDVELPDAPKFTATLIENRPDLTQYTLSGRRPDSFLPEYPRVLANDGKLVALTADGKEVLATELKKSALTKETMAGGERSLEITNVTTDFPLLAEGFQGQNGTMIEWTLKTPAGQQSGSSVIGQPTLTRFQRARLKVAPDARLKGITLEAAPWTIAYHKDRAALWVRRENAALANDPLQPMRAMDEAAVVALPIRGLPRYYEQGDFFRQQAEAAAEAAGTKVTPNGVVRRLLGHQTAIDAKPLALPIGTVNDVNFTVTAFAPYARLTTKWKEVADAPLDPRLDLSLTSAADERSFPRLIPPSTSDGIEDQAMSWVHCADQGAYDTLRAKLVARFPAPTGTLTEPTQEEAARTRLVFVTSPAIAGPGRKVLLLVAAPDSALREFPLIDGSEARIDLFGDTLTVRLNAILQRPRQVTEPLVVPKEQRTSRMSVGDYESLIQVTATGTQGVTSVWVPYTPYPNLPRSLGNDGSLGMYAPRPVWLDVPGAGRFELCYGKEALPMPGPIWMTGFEVPRRPGSNSPSEFYCHVAYSESGGDLAKPETAVIHMNNPLAWQDTFFFQASWDPQSQALTVLGVGNRPAGNAMLLASIILALGIAISGALAALPRSKS